ncbi:hypothetical protein VTN02DRAFT_3825 [Thermoascus thermophilus]
MGGASSSGHIAEQAEDHAEKGAVTQREGRDDVVRNDGASDRSKGLLYGDGLGWVGEGEGEWQLRLQGEAAQGLGEQRQLDGTTRPRQQLDGECHGRDSVPVYGLHAVTGSPLDGALCSSSIGPGSIDYELEAPLPNHGQREPGRGAGREDVGDLDLLRRCWTVTDCSTPTIVRHRGAGDGREMPLSRLERTDAERQRRFLDPRGRQMFGLVPP